MEKPLLEKIIEKLEKIDIRGWEYTTAHGDFIFTTINSGLKFRLSLITDPPMPYKYHFDVIDENKDKKIEYGHKAEKELIKRFYEKIKQEYDKFVENEFQEKLDNFLSE